jgi:hypothetical protein
MAKNYATALNISDNGDDFLKLTTSNEFNKPSRININSLNIDPSGNSTTSLLYTLPLSGSPTLGQILVADVCGNLNFQDNSPLTNPMLKDLDMSNNSIMKIDGLIFAPSKSGAKCSISVDTSNNYMIFDAASQYNFKNDIQFTYFDESGTSQILSISALVNKINELVNLINDINNPEEDIVPL